MRHANAIPIPRSIWSTQRSGTATGLRSTVTELHPQVMAQLGLAPAVRELLRPFESRTGYLLCSTPALTSSPAFGMTNAGRATPVDIIAAARTTVAGAAIFTRRPG